MAKKEPLRMSQAAKENMGAGATAGAMAGITSFQPTFPHGLIAAGVLGAVGAGAGAVKTIRDAAKARKHEALNPNQLK